MQARDILENVLMPYNYRYRKKGYSKIVYKFPSKVFEHPICFKINYSIYKFSTNWEEFLIFIIIFRTINFHLCWFRLRKSFREWKLALFFQLRILNLFTYRERNLKVLLRRLKNLHIYLNASLNLNFNIT